MKLIDSRIKVDIDNDRIVDNDVVKLSREDFVIDYSGKKITLKEGMYVHLYTDDTDDKGEPSFYFFRGNCYKKPLWRLNFYSNGFVD